MGYRWALPTRQAFVIFKTWNQVVSTGSNYWKSQRFLSMRDMVITRKAPQLRQEQLEIYPYDNGNRWMNQ